MMRFSYLDSCRQLQALSLLRGEPPRMRDRMPRYEGGEPWGVSFFRSKVTDKVFQISPYAGPTSADQRLVMFRSKTRISPSPIYVGTISQTWIFLRRRWCDVIFAAPYSIG